MRAKWKVILEGARQEALLAADLYNQPRHARRLEGFFVHMHIAWLYLLQARFKRDRVDCRYRLPNGRLERVDGEPRTWDLQKCVSERYPDEGAIRKNLEFTIGLRNKIEHRYEDATTAVVAGRAQALLVNFEAELVETFGERFSLGDQLRFPVFVGTLTGVSEISLLKLRDSLPRSVRDFIARFELELDTAIVEDQRYDFRVYLIPKLGPRTEADRSITFVRESELSDEERHVLSEFGRSGRVIVREQVREVAGADKLRPGEVVAAVAPRIPFEFNMSHFVAGWKQMDCRPPTSSPNPDRTDARYCVYDKPHRDYVYKQAFVEKLVREGSTASKFQSFFGKPPVPRAAGSM